MEEKTNDEVTRLFTEQVNLLQETHKRILVPQIESIPNVPGGFRLVISILNKVDESKKEGTTEVAPEEGSTAQSSGSEVVSEDTSKEAPSSEAQQEPAGTQES